VPYADCEYNLGNLYLRLGQEDKAEARFRYIQREESINAVESNFIVERS
jgi:hypothetical protein